MNRVTAINFMLENPYVHITHVLFDENEYIFATEDGDIYDENGYLFEDWAAFSNGGGRNGLRARTGKEWQTGWRIKE